jgi:hypothetical protein
MIDVNGFPTQPWADWMQKVFDRIGGMSAYTNDELAENDFTTFARMQNIASDRLIGRDTASSGDPEEIGVGGGIEFNGSGAIRTSAFTGDVTKSAGGTAQTIANNAVSFIKMLSTDWTKDTSASGYTKLPNGLYIQWGVTGSYTTGTTNAVSFPIAFPTACRQVIAGIQGNSASSTASTGTWGTGNYSTTGFDLYNRTSLTFTFNYMAVGY